MIWIRLLRRNRKKSLFAGTSIPARAGILANLAFVLLAIASSAHAAFPTLSIRSIPPDVQISWTNVGAGFVLQAASTLAPPAEWITTGLAPLANGDVRIVTLQPGTATRFYRLASLRGTQVTHVSPAEGETGVSVTRETILTLSAPLAADETVTAQEVYLEANGVRLLSRAEISSDRRTLTIFPLENMPGGSRVIASIRGDELRDESGNAVDADNDGQSGGLGSVAFHTAGVVGLAGTGVEGRVLASEPGPGGANLPLVGVTITVNGAEETLRTVTDDTGFFRLLPAPAGRFFVHIDGRTATASQWPGGTYYPYIGKCWEALPGYTNNKAAGTGLIYLPRIQSDALTTVSATQPTVVALPQSVVATNPALSGITLRVPPNALYNDNGTRGGQVGMALVPPDRLPEPLPSGLNLPVVITIQTDGPTNFDTPVPARFPNLPDPVTGIKLGPGAKTVLWSFNHDTGRWEPQGTCTITADGQFAETDPGVGVRQPGWHGVAPGSPASGPPVPNPPPEPPAPDPNEDPCERDQQLAMNSALDLATDLMMETQQLPWGIDCALGLALDTVRTARDCTAAGGDQFSDDCGDIAADNAIGVGLGCIPVVGGILDLGWGGKQLIDNGFNYYDCTQNQQGRAARSALQRQSAPDLLDAGSPAELLASALAEQQAFSLASSNVLQVWLGSPVWFGVTNRQQETLYKGILEEIRQAVSPTGLAGTMVTSEEQTALQALQRPESISASDVVALAARISGFKNGTLKTNTAERVAIDNALRSFLQTAQPLQAAGWRTGIDGFRNALLALTQMAQVNCPDTSSTSGTSGGGTRSVSTLTGTLPYRWLIVNHDAGFSLRGTLRPFESVPDLSLAPESFHGLYYLDPRSMRIGFAFFRSALSGEPTILPCPHWAPSGARPLDSDADGLTDLAEWIVGTSSQNPDTDGDGVSDGAELRTGGNPSDGFALNPGLIGSTYFPDGAVDVAINRNYALVACAGTGLKILDVTDPFSPILAASLSLNGGAISIAAANDLAVLGTPSGVAIVDVRDAEKPVLRALNPVGEVEPVALDHEFAYAGIRNGVAVVDLSNDSLRQIYNMPGADIDAIAVQGSALYVLTANELVTLKRLGPFLSPGHSLPIAGTKAPLEYGRELLVAGARAYVGYFTGFSILNLSDPFQPAISGSPAVNQAAIHSLALAGPRRLVPVVSFAGEGTLAPALYDVTDPSDVTRFLGSFATPGAPRAAAVDRGLAYVADGLSGLAVVNLVGGRNDTTPPSVAFARALGSPNPRVERSTHVTAYIEADDDTLVRQVTLRVNGNPVGTDGSYPFEIRFATPAVAGANLVLQAEAFDVAGNRSLTPPLQVSVIEDATPPSLLAVFPAPGARIGSGLLNEITFTFNEPLANVGPGSASVQAAGPDGALGTPDDLPLPAQAIQAIGTQLVWTAASAPLPDGPYRLNLASNLKDTAGNATLEPWTSDFEVLSSLPRLVAVNPKGRLREQGETHPTLFVGFSPAFPPDLVTQIHFSLAEAGPDSTWDTADDRPWTTAGARADTSGALVFVDVSPALGEGKYRLTAQGPVVSPATLEFVLGDAFNSWVAPASGPWRIATNWTYPLVSFDNLVIALPDADITTTLDSTVPMLRTLHSEEAFVFERGDLRVTDTATFLGPAVLGGGNSDNPVLTGGGKFRFLGGLDIRSSTVATYAVQLQNASLINGGKARWISGDIQFNSTNALIVNSPDATFEIEPAARRLQRPNTGSGRFLNAGLITKPAGTNIVGFERVSLENSGRVQVGDGALRFMGYTGDGDLSVQSNGAVALSGNVTLGPSARVTGTGRVQFGWFQSTTVYRATAEVYGNYDLEGYTVVDEGSVTFHRPIQSPSSGFRVEGTARFVQPVELGDLTVATASTGVAQFDSAATLESVTFEFGTISGAGAILVNRDFHWKRGSFLPGGELSLAGNAWVDLDGQLSRRLHVRPGAALSITNDNATSLAPATGQVAGQVLNEGTLHKTGLGRFTLLVHVINDGQAIISSGAILMGSTASPRWVQGPSGQILLQGGQFGINNTSQLSLEAGSFGGVGELRLTTTSTATLQNAATLRVGNPTGTLKVSSLNLSLAPTSETLVTLASDVSSLLEVQRNLNLGGRLHIALTAGFTPALGQSFVIARAAARTGTFAEILAPGLPPSLRAQVDYLANEVVVRITGS